MEPKVCSNCGAAVYYAALGMMGVVSNEKPVYAGYAYDAVCSKCGGHFVVFET